MQSYRVIRSFPGYEVGQVITGGVMINQFRAAQLVNQRYIEPVGGEGQGSLQQPTVAALLGATVRQLDSLVAQVEDACLLQAAADQDERESALRLYERRLAELAPAEPAGGENDA